MCMCVCVYILGASKWMLRPTLKNLGQLARTKEANRHGHPCPIHTIRALPTPQALPKDFGACVVRDPFLDFLLCFALLCFLAVGIDSPFSPISPICRSFPILAGGWAYLVIIETYRTYVRTSYNKVKAHMQISSQLLLVCAICR